MTIEKVTELYRISSDDPGWAYSGMRLDPCDHEDEPDVSFDKFAELYTSEAAAQKELDMLKEYFPGFVEFYGLHIEMIWEGKMKAETLQTGKEVI